MRSRTRLSAVAVVAAVSLGVLAGCGSSNGGGTSTGGATAASVGEHNIIPPGTGWGSPPSSPTGTLNVVGSGDVDHLDTCCAYYTVTYELLRAISRQLVSYQSAPGKVIGKVTPVPDLATFKVSKGSTVFTFTMKPGVKWQNGQPVTSQDEVLGLKRLCNPVQAAPPLAYWENNIAGMKSYCAGFAKISLSKNPSTEIGQLKSYMSSHNISGLSTPNSRTIVITLMHPSSSFINIMAMPMSSPVPPSVNNYLPASVQEEKNFPSDGPYKLVSYTPGASITLTTNPEWSQSSDSLRHQYVKNIDITEGVSATSVQERLQTGDADFEWDTTVPTSDVQSLTASHSKNFFAVFQGGITYLAYNMTSTADGGALRKVAVRQALEYCIDKKHLVQVTGGPAINVPDNQILAPGIIGFKAINPYPSPNNQGNPAKCKSMLAKAGYPHGLTLTVTYPNNPPAPAQFTAMQSDFAKAGVRLKADEQPSQGEYFTYVATPSKRNQWDIAYGAWFPDWPGNAAQTYFSPLFDGRLYTVGSTDYGDYNDSYVNSQIDKALSTGSVSGAAKIWQSLDSYIMTKDPGWIPMLYNALPEYYGTKVKNPVYNEEIGAVDLTQAWK
jgi:ABC-type transport system substrate-binding protein